MDQSNYMTDQELADWNYILNHWVTYGPVVKEYIIRQTLLQGKPITAKDIKAFETMMDLNAPQD
ncbi:Uncharacterised protein [uncultured archaeon]|nr:Uncharacterised protein [uncultured archaeon]